METQIGHYQSLAPLGAGGMGAVYRARAARLDREVAIKVLPADFAKDADRLKRFAQEARATSALDQPNIITGYDIGEKETSQRPTAREVAQALQAIERGKDAATQRRGDRKRNADVAERGQRRCACGRRLLGRSAAVQMARRKCGAGSVGGRLVRRLVRQSLTT